MWMERSSNYEWEGNPSPYSPVLVLDGAEGRNKLTVGSDEGEHLVVLLITNEDVELFMENEGEATCWRAEEGHTS